VSALSVEQLTHRYPPQKPRRSRRGVKPVVHPDRPALDHVSFDIRPGEIFGILGPNGGGKTTLFRIIATLMTPSSGAVRVFGNDVLGQPTRVRQTLGVVFQNPSLDGKLSAAENLMHHGHLYGLRGSDLDRRIGQWLTQFNLADRRDHDVEHFSGGMRRRVELAKALLHEPRLLLLDEPATGLDPGARRDLWNSLERLRRERQVTIVLTTHLMDEADRCDRLAIIHEGKLVAVDTPANLKARIGGDVVTASPRGSADDLAKQITARFAPWPAGAQPVVADGEVHIERPDGPRFVAELAAAFPDQLQSIKVGQPTLEDVFLHLTGHTLHES
jgi:ABC-2 type transport system ATP-binding protein